MRRIKVIANPQTLSADRKAPFPWFGGKWPVAEYIARRIGTVKQYTEPFGGTLSVLLHRDPAPLEIVGDLDCNVANFWRSIKSNPDLVAEYADHPAIHIDIHARHNWLRGKSDELVEKLIDPNWPGDHKAAGWWVWGLSLWIGSGWCASRAQVPHMGDAGRGIRAQVPHMGDAGRGIRAQVPHMSDAGQGIRAQVPHMGNAGQGIRGWLAALSARLQRTTVVNGTWERMLGTHYGLNCGGTVGVFLDPPYFVGNDLYGHSANTGDVARAALEIVDRGGSRARVAICGLSGDYPELRGWDCVGWSRIRSTYGKTSGMKSEAIWFSPGCLELDWPTEGDPADSVGGSASQGVLL